MNTKQVIGVCCKFIQGVKIAIQKWMIEQALKKQEKEFRTACGWMITYAEYVLEIDFDCNPRVLGGVLHITGHYPDKSIYHFQANPAQLRAFLKGLGYCKDRSSGLVRYKENYTVGEVIRRFIWLLVGCLVFGTGVVLTVISK